VAPVPALVSQEQFDQAQAKLAQNQQFARRHNTAHAYLLRALVSCGVCHLGCVGRSVHPGYAYYQCRGKAHPIQSGREQRCPARFIPAAQLDAVVWADLGDVLTHPASLIHALERAHAGHWLPQELQARREQLRRGRQQLAGQLERLSDAYLQAVIPLAEYRRRRQDLEQRLGALDRQGRELEAQAERKQALAGLTASVEDFCQRVQAGLAHTTFDQRRQLVELLIDRVVVTNGDVEIRYVIPTTPASEQVRFCHLRTDYFHHVAPGVDRLVEGQRATGSGRAPCSLVGALENGVRDVALPKQLPTAGITVALVRDNAVGPGPRASPPTGSSHPNAVEHGRQLGTVMAVSRSNDDGQGPSLAVAGQVEFGRQPAPAAPEPLVGWVLDPLFTDHCTDG
jgi:hypothetical protein